MAVVFTKKNGRLFVLNGLARRLLDDSGNTGAAEGMCTFQGPDGTWYIFYLTQIFGTAEIRMITTNDPLTVEASTGTTIYSFAFLKQADWIQCDYQPSAGAQGTIHLWWDDNSPSPYGMKYMKSTDLGSTWSTPATVILGGKGGIVWDSLDVYPLGVHVEDATGDMTMVVMGRYANRMSFHQYTATGDLSNPANYTLAPGASATDGFMALYNIFGAAAGYYEQGGYWQLFVSTDDLTGDPADIEWIRYYRGNTDGTNWEYQCVTLGQDRDDSNNDDDESMRPRSTYYDGNVLWLFYTDDNTFPVYPMAAVANADAPCNMMKIPGLRELQDIDYEEVYWCLGDLTFATPTRRVRINDRGAMGTLVSALDAPVRGAFTMKYIQVGTGGEDAGSPEPDFFDYLWQTDPGTYHGVLEVPTPTCHVLFVTYDDDGNEEEYYLFLRCVIDPVSFAEAIDGDEVSISFSAYGLFQPLFGRY